jgi:hypothetical protein
MLRSLQRSQRGRWVLWPPKARQHGQSHAQLSPVPPHLPSAVADLSFVSDSQAHNSFSSQTSYSMIVFPLETSSFGTLEPLGVVMVTNVGFVCSTGVCVSRKCGISKQKQSQKCKKNQCNALFIFPSLPRSDAAIRCGRWATRKPVVRSLACHHSQMSPE